MSSTSERPVFFGCWIRLEQWTSLRDFFDVSRFPARFRSASLKVTPNNLVKKGHELTLSSPAPGELFLNLDSK